eukprot:scaffold127629_cov36-Tisochrysis_lutea.AAC.1
MGEYTQAYSSTSGIIISTVLKTHYDPRKPYTNAPSTDDTCERIIPIRKGHELSIDYASRHTQIFSNPIDYYVITEQTLPPRARGRASEKEGAWFWVYDADLSPPPFVPFSSVAVDSSARGGNAPVEVFRDPINPTSRTRCRFQSSYVRKSRGGGRVGVRPVALALVTLIPYNPFSPRQPPAITTLLTLALASRCSLDVALAAVLALAQACLLTGFSPSAPPKWSPSSRLPPASPALISRRCAKSYAFSSTNLVLLAPFCTLFAWAWHRMKGMCHDFRLTWMCSGVNVITGCAE